MSSESFGPLLRHWRRARGKSQLDLACEAQVSTRHLSFIENGRAQPSRTMVLQLAEALDVPLRERNALLAGAGFMPEFRETALDAAEMAEGREAVALVLRGHAPNPALCFDRRGAIVMANQPWVSLARALEVGYCARAYEVAPPPRLNLVETLLVHAGARRAIKNWNEVACAVVQRARRELMRDGDESLRAELEQIVRASGVRFERDAGRDTRLILALELELAGVALRFFSTLTTLGTAFDITLHELRIESYHPADAATDAAVRAAVSGD